MQRTGLKVRKAALGRMLLVALMVVAGSFVIGREKGAIETRLLGETECLARQPNCAPRITPRVGEPPLLVEAAPGAPWIFDEDIKASSQLTSKPVSLTVRLPMVMLAKGSDSAAAPQLPPVPPAAPTNLLANADGLFLISGKWDAPLPLARGGQGSIARYDFAIGSGTDPAHESDVRYWQSVGTNLSFVVHHPLNEGAPIYVTVRAVNDAGLISTYTRSAPITPIRKRYGEAANLMRYAIGQHGLDASGAITHTWSETKTVQLRDFLDRMLPVLGDIYGPPSTSYTVTLVRDLRYKASAIFFPDTDEIHTNDSLTLTYQLLTHELIHAWRNDRILASGPDWAYSVSYSSFEEGFAQAVSYAAMTEFVRRNPDFPLSQKIYASSAEWDYDFHNVPELRTTDFWSNGGGTQLHWMRYEMAAAAMQKIQNQYPGFYKKFNANYYARLNANPMLVISRGLLIDLIAEIAPTIEGLPAADWINQQHVLATAFVPGEKVWRYSQHYPNSNGEFLTFNTVHAYETFSNGSDWAWYKDGAYMYYHLNGITGTSTLALPQGGAILRPHLISPTQNPDPANPASTFVYGSAKLNLMGQASHSPWPGGSDDESVTHLTQFGLYTLTTQFYTGTRVISSTVFDVHGAVLANTTGVWGGIVGASGGTVTLKHRASPNAVTVPLVNGAFHARVDWAGNPHPDTNSIDSTPGLVDITYNNGSGTSCAVTRSIGYGSWYGNQAFLFAIKDGHLQSAYATSDMPNTRALCAVPTPTPTLTPTPTASFTPTRTPTRTPTPTFTPTPNPTRTPTATPSFTPTPTPTHTATATWTATSTATSTETPTATATSAPIPTSVPTAMPVPTQPVTPTPSASSTSTATNVPPTAQSTNAPPAATVTVVLTVTPALTLTPVITPLTLTATQTATLTATSTTLPTQTPTVTALPSTATVAPTETATATAAVTPKAIAQPGGTLKLNLPFVMR